VALLGGSVVLLIIADVVNVGTASFFAYAGSRVGRSLSDLAALTLAAAALWLASDEARYVTGVAIVGLR